MFVASIVVIVIILVAFFAYVGWTYTRTVATISFSFAAGVDSRTQAFEQPFLDDKAEVQVSVQSGAALWRARILSGDQVVWEHTAVQGEQQSYSSGWIQLPSKGYNFTFGTIGGGSLEASANVNSKGGFW
jgi:uncharacterized membrane protein